MNRDSLGRFAIGSKPWNTGIGIKEETKKQISETLKNSDSNKNEKHHGWKGDKASYYAIHRWIRIHFIRPDYCEICLSKKVKRFEWANITGIYTRDREDYLNLCTTCHKKYDMNRRKNESA